MDDQNSIIKLLVDRISTKLDILDGQLKVYQPILDRVGTQSDNTITELNNIKNDIKNISKLLDTTASDFYDRTNNILKTIEDILEKCTDSNQILLKNQNDIVNIKKIISDENGLNVKLGKIQSEMEPISKFLSFVGKPVGFIIFIIGIIIASITITNISTNVINYWKVPSSQQQKSN